MNHEIKSGMKMGKDNVPKEIDPVLMGQQRKMLSKINFPNMQNWKDQNRN